MTITGSTLRPRLPAEKGRIARALEERVWPLLESGAVKPTGGKTLNGLIGLVEELAEIAPEKIAEERGATDLVGAR